jgi:hypothetical protein
VILLRRSQLIAHVETRLLLEPRTIQLADDPAGAIHRIASRWILELKAILVINLLPSPSTSNASN